MRHYLALSLGAALAAVFLSGCGREGPERVIVTGTVTYHEKPLPVGEIRFIPEPGLNVPVSGARITDGKYRVEARGGVPVGKHKVTIEGFYFDGPKGPVYSLDPQMKLGPFRHQYLPAKYNTATEIKLTIESGSGAITKDYALTD